MKADTVAASSQTGKNANGKCHEKHILINPRVGLPFTPHLRSYWEWQHPGKTYILIKSHDVHFWNRLKGYYYYTKWSCFKFHAHTLLLAKCKGVFKSLSFTVRSAWALFTKISTEKAKRKLLRLHVNYMHVEEVTTKTITHLCLHCSHNHS